MNPLGLSEADWTAIALSLKVAATATVVSLPFGIMVAFWLSRSQVWGTWIVSGLVALPLVLPPVVTGYLLLLSFGRRGAAGMFLEQCCGLVFSFRWTGAALASAVMGFPLMVRAIRMSFDTIDRGLEEASSTLGASPAWVFVTVTLPLALPGIVAGAILAFAKSLGEFGATITFVSNIPGETQTIASSIYTDIQVPGGDAPAMRLTLVAIVIAMAALAASEWLSRVVMRRTVPR
ncbi:molybdate ABC transporter permease subunit [Lichenihabitans sp. PAMC28606]|uniref:molybdate ABC transporter permease subunit n=1 Tax=Lichenihabitans sp. PAMC28606 TaxID=2880932 RepID=UPI001D09B500|nr:molybdate ABC transporter permease subunit [Lichenihabitans sp. PAMC28606]UDL96544.1 molybdate ABC transporter permease subunit [Lichenihabitans sp. PAMC28606]